MKVNLHAPFLVYRVKTLLCVQQPAAFTFNKMERFRYRLHSYKENHTRDLRMNLLTALR